MVNWTPRNKLQWNFNRSSYIFIQENAFENVVWKMAAILLRPQCVEWTPLSTPLRKYIMNILRRCSTGCVCADLGVNIKKVLPKGCYTENRELLWCQLCNRWRHCGLSERQLPCNQLRQSWHHDNFQTSVLKLPILDCFEETCICHTSIFIKFFCIETVLKLGPRLCTCKHSHHFYWTGHSNLSGRVHNTFI